MVMHSAFVIILGSPASGKTSLSVALSSDLHIACYRKDEIKEALFDTLGVSERDWSSRLSRASFAVLLRLGSAQACAGLPCMLEGNWRAEHTAALTALAQEAQVPMAQVCCYAEAPEIERRFRSRRRHAGHLDGRPWDEIAANMPREPVFLDLPGARWVYRGEGRGEYAQLRHELGIWLERAHFGAKSGI
ncbi:MAG: AAA family ATPase [Steroidobacteraceae bacterium]|jgi:predicted kinase